MKKLIFLTVTALLFFHAPVSGQGVDIAMKAFELRMDGHPYAALDLLDSALKVHPDSARLWFEKGRCVDWVKADGCDKFIHLYTKMSPRLRDTRRCFRRAIRLEPDHARYHFWAAGATAVGALAAIYTPWQWPLVPFKFRKTATHARNAVLYAPDNAVYRYELVEYTRFGWLLSGSKKLCYAHLDTLEMLDPVYAVMARDEMSTKKHPYDALASLKALEPSYPEHPRLLEQMTRELGALIKTDSAYVDTIMGYYVRLRTVEPRNPQTLSRMVRFMNRYNTGDPLPWIQAYLEAVDGDYAYYRATGLRLLAAQVKKQGDEELSKTYREEADKLYPEGSGSWMKDMEKP